MEDRMRVTSFIARLLNSIRRRIRRPRLGRKVSAKTKLGCHRAPTRRTAIFFTVGEAAEYTVCPITRPAPKVIQAKRFGHPWGALAMKDRAAAPHSRRVRTTVGTFYPH